MCAINNSAFHIYKHLEHVYRQYDVIMSEYFRELARAVEHGNDKVFDIAVQGMSHRLQQQQRQREEYFRMKQAEYTQHWTECEHQWSTSNVTNSSDATTWWRCEKCGEQRQGSSP